MQCFRNIRSMLPDGGVHCTSNTPYDSEITIFPLRSCTCNKDAHDIMREATRRSLEGKSKFLSMKNFGRKHYQSRKLKPSADVNVLLVNHQEITHAARE